MRGKLGNQMAILNNQPFMGMRNYSMPPALSGYDFTPAQLHARRTEPTVNMHYDANGNLVPANTASINAYQGDIVSNNTDDTGGYTDEQIAALTTHGETLDNRYSSILMNQDHARNAMGDAVEYGVSDSALTNVTTPQDASQAEVDGRNSSMLMSEDPAGISIKSNVGPNTSKGVLTSNNGTAASTGNAARRMTGGYTGNARGSALPNMQIGLGERLMRMGMAGLSKGGQGSLAQMGAMFGASADVNKANREASMEAFGIEEERRQAHANRVAALAASKNKGADAATDFSSMASSLTEMEGLYAMLGQENLTGPLMGTVGKWAEGAGLFDFFRDKPKDAMKAYARFQLQGLKVDDTLLRVAQTKGAISDAEMKLFQSDTPSMTDSEGVWQRYLNERMVVLRKALAAQGYALNAPVKVGGATITPIAD